MLQAVFWHRCVFHKVINIATLASIEVNASCAIGTAASRSCARDTKNSPTPCVQARRPPRRKILRFRVLP